MSNLASFWRIAECALHFAACSKVFAIVRHFECRKDEVVYRHNLPVRTTAFTLDLLDRFRDFVERFKMTHSNERSGGPVTINVKRTKIIPKVNLWGSWFELIHSSYEAVMSLFIILLKSFEPLVSEHSGSSLQIQTLPSLASRRGYKVTQVENWR